MKFGDYIGTPETTYVESNFWITAKNEFKKVFGMLPNDYDIILGLIYGHKTKCFNPYIFWLYTTIYNEIVKSKFAFTEEFHVIDIPETFSMEDADNLVSILRKAGINYGLHIRRLTPYTFTTQWEKEYILTSDAYVNPEYGADQYRMTIKEEMGKQILKSMNRDFSKYTRDIWEIYFKGHREYPFEADLDPAGKFGLKQSEYWELSKKAKEEKKHRERNQFEIHCEESTNDDLCM